MADIPTSLSKVPRNRVPDGARVPEGEQVRWVLDGASRLAEIVRRSAMRRISVTMDGVQWEIEAPAPPLCPLRTVSRKPVRCGGMR